MRLAAKNTIIFLMIYILGIFCCVFVIPKLASYVPGVIRIGLKSNSPQDIVIGLAYGKNKPYQSVETVEHLSSGEFKNYKIHVPATKIQYIYFKPIHAPATKIQAKRVTFKSIKTGYSTDALKLKDFVSSSITKSVNHVIDLEPSTKVYLPSTFNQIPVRISISFTLILFHLLLYIIFRNYIESTRAQWWPIVRQEFNIIFAFFNGITAGVSAFEKGLLWINTHYYKKCNLLTIILLIPVFISIFAIILQIEYKNITYPYPLELREPAVIFLTDAFFKGVNPYEIKNLPFYLYQYGPVYNFIALMVLKTLPAQVISYSLSLQLHRCLSHCFIYSTLFILLLFVRKNNPSKILLASLALFLLLQMVNTWVGIARPDAFGTLMVVLGTYLFQRCCYDFKGFLGLLLCATLGFFSKQYFLIIFPLACLYTFLFISKKNALIYALVGVVFFASILYGVNKLFPYYIANTLYSFAPDISVAHRHDEIELYIKLNSILVLTSIILFILFAHRVFQKNIFGNLLNIFKLFSFNQINTGLLKISPSLKTYTIFYLLGFLMINIYLAGNPYNSYMYSVTLVTPFLILMIIQNLSDYKGLSLLVASLVIINIVQFYFYSNKVLVQKIPNFIKIERILKTKRNILSDPYFSTIIADQKKSVWDTGQTQIFKMLTIDSVPLYMRLPAQRVWQAYVTHIENQIANKQYDLVVLYTGYLESDLYRLKGKNLLMKNYYISQYIGNEELWLPKP